MKLNKKTVVRRIVQLTLLLAGMHAIFTSRAQEASKPVKDITALSITYTALQNSYGTHKQIPAGYEKPILTALSYFPELKNTRITFKIKKSNKGIISTRPTIGSLFRRSSKRRYLVFINDTAANRTIPAFAMAPINGQVGILGHEFCHILYFNKKTGLGLLGLGIAHVSKNYMDKFERNTDSINIERGLGYQLMSWKAYLTERFKASRPAQPAPANAPPEPKRYMSVAAIQKQIDNSKIYKQVN